MPKGVKTAREIDYSENKKKSERTGNSPAARRIKGESGKYVVGYTAPVVGFPVATYGSGKIQGPKGVDFESGKGQRMKSVLKPSGTRSESQLTSIEKMDLTRKGISKKELEQLKKRAGLDYDQLSYILQVARVTLIAKKGVEKFSPLLSEKIVSLADIYSYGYEVFGNDEAFNKWIFQPVAALGGLSPYEILDNQYGREEVKHIIGRIEYGVYS